MRILLYNPDNGVTRNFMPHLWMFLLQAITPPDHEVILIDANARRAYAEGGRRGLDARLHDEASVDASAATH